MSSDTSARHTFIDIVGANPICRDLVERTKGRDLEAAIDLEQRKEAHYGDYKGGTPLKLLSDTMSTLRV